jgi:ubiquinone/menaquinone biosynthesis C-methylase UbiE
MFPRWSTLGFEQYRAGRMAAYLAEHVRPGETVLDCGCGSLLMARRLRDLAGVRAFGTDVINLNRTDLSLCLCPGERLPLADLSVDTVCLLFVLHHADQPDAILRECLRVARRRVIVAEDVFENALELLLLKGLDWFGNRSVSSEMRLPFNFRTEAEWRAEFARLGVRSIRAWSIRPVPWRLSRHRLFVLEPAARG